MLQMGKMSHGHAINIGPTLLTKQPIDSYTRATNKHFT